MTGEAPRIPDRWLPVLAALLLGVAALLAGDLIGTGREQDDNDGGQQGADDKGWLQMGGEDRSGGEVGYQCFGTGCMYGHTYIDRSERPMYVTEDQSVTAVRNLHVLPLKTIIVGQAPSPIQ